jgi:hypothetical protein
MNTQLATREHYFQIYAMLNYFSILSKNESRLIKSPVCVSPTKYLNRLVHFHEIWYTGNAIQGDIEAIMFNPIVSIILKLLRFKVLR